MPDVLTYLRSLPRMTRIPTPAELDDALLRLARADRRAWRVERVGASAHGRPLRVLSIGGGARHVLVIGGPHANEPIGFLTMLHLARLLAERPALREGRTWHLLPCLDPDGAARMITHWYGGPYALRAYHRGFYRPPMAQHPEAAFGRDEQPAGTVALRTLLRELRPAVMCSLHNADFGGAFFILNRALFGLPTVLQRLTAAWGMPLSRSHADTFGWPSPGLGVYVRPEVASRTHLSAYAQRYGTLSFVPEVPVWADLRSASGLAYGVPYDRTLVTAARAIRADMDLLECLSCEGGDEAIMAAFADTVAIGRWFASGWERLAGAGPPVITVAEVAALAHARHSTRLRALGLLLRGRPGGGLFDTWCAEAVAQIAPRSLPLRTLAAVQLGAVLAAATGAGGWPAWR